MWFPNFLTSLRIIAAAAFPFVVPEARISLVVFCLITEFFDGFTARMCGWETQLGKILDPVADKLFSISAGVTLVVAKKLSATELLFMLARDAAIAPVFILTVIFWRSRRTISGYQPNFGGKLTTVLQYAVFFLALLNERPPIWLIYLTGIASSIAAIFYVFGYIEYLKKSKATVGAHEKDQGILL